MKKEMKEGKDEYGDPKLRILLYRGLGLPEDAISIYEKYMKEDKMFDFTAFTSTSTDKKIALEFAYKAKERG